jgi:thioredoxin 1
MEEKMDKENGLVLEVTTGNIDELVKNSPSLVVDCWAPWCGPCRMMTPVIEELARDFKGKITFGKLNTDENQEVASKYGIQAIPTLLIFKDGKLTDRKVGALPKKALEGELTKSLA